MRWSCAARIAQRELRGGIRGFRVLLACLILGVASVAAIGTVRSNIETGLTEQGAILLGGDAELELSYRFATEDEMSWLQDRSISVSETVQFRSMAVVGSGIEARRALTQLKTVDELYPIYGTIELDPPISLEEAFSEENGTFGAIMHGDLINRLQLEIGDKFKLGSNNYQLNARLVREPDGVNTGFALGPRTLVRTSSIENSGLIGPGSLYSTHYRLKLELELDLDLFRTELEAALGDSGLQWTDRRNGNPSARAFVQRAGSFLVLVGLAGIAVGGVGVAAAVRTYLESKTRTIATLKTLGSDRHTIFITYLIQIGVMITVGVIIGVLAGALIPWILEPFIATILPIPIERGLDIQPLAEAALYGVLAGLASSLWSLSKTFEIRAAELYRIGGSQNLKLPPPLLMIAILFIAGTLIAVATFLSGAPRIAIWTFCGIVISLLILGLASIAIRFITKKLGKSVAMRGYTGTRLALGSIGGPNSDATPVILSLGLGLTVLATVGQISSNLNFAIVQEIPERAPTYFVVDLQKDQFDSFTQLAGSQPEVTDLVTAPMLRGIISKINGVNALEVAGDHWVLQGDRGITYAATPPEDTIITEGNWWPEDYSGEPLVSFADEEARELGLNIGDTLTLNILGREIQTTVSSFREVAFETIGIGFVMMVNPSAVASAPHTHIATLYTENDAEQNLFRNITSAFPNVTVISVKEGVERIERILSALSGAISYGSGITLATGLVVLIGAAAASERRRVYESAILKTLGASRRRILTSLAIRSTILGAASGVVAIIAGGIAGWAIMTFVMESNYRFEPFSAFAIVLGGGLMSLFAGLLFALTPLSVSPSRILRSPD